MKINAKDIESYCKKYGKRGEMELEAIRAAHDNLPGILDSEVGRGVLAEDIIRASSLMSKCYNQELTDDERIELRYIKGRIDTIAIRLHTVEKAEKVVLDNMKKV